MAESKLYPFKRTTEPLKNFFEVPSHVYHRIFSDDKYRAILEILDNPLTIDELEEMYQRVKLQKEKKLSKIKKSKKLSLYRYVQHLIDIGLVKQVGRVADRGKILYQKKAKIFLIENPTEQNFDSPQARRLVSIIGLIVSPDWTQTEKQVTKLLVVAKKYHETALLIRNQLLNQILDLNDQVAHELIIYLNTFSVEQTYSFFENLDDLLWIMRAPLLNDYQKQIQNILTEHPPSERIIEFPKEVSTIRNDTYQDFVTFQPVPVKVMSKKIWQATVSDIRLRAIIKILRQMPMTIKEIHQRHKHVMEEIREYDKQKGKYNFKTDSLIKEKTENSIYRYLQTLKKGGYVIEAGRRIMTANAQVTQMLYSRTARTFLHFSNSDEFWQDEDNETVLTRSLSMVLQHTGSGRSLKLQYFENFLLEYINARSQQLKERWERITDSQLTDQFFSLTDGELQVVIRSVAHLGWILTQKDPVTYQTRLKECFM